MRYDFYVAVSGDDAWSGKKKSPDRKGTDGPFASLKRAKEAVRTLKKEGGLKMPLRVAVRGGVYLLDEPLIFEPEDSDTEYLAYPGEVPVITGAKKVTGWQEEAGGIWSVDVSALTSRDGVCRQLFINGERKKRARMPDKGFYIVDGAFPKTGEPLRFRYREGDLKKEWADDGTEVVFLEKWYAIRHNVTVINEADREITLKGVSRSYSVPDQRYYLENVRSGIEEPGAWYFDHREKRIYYNPLPDEDMNSVDTLVPVLIDLIRFDGDKSGKKTVENISFSGITFSYTSWVMDEEGYNDRQAAYDIPAAVQAYGAKNCRFEKCRFLSLGGYGVEWSEGCRDNSIMDSEFTDLGAGGIKIGTGGIPSITYEDPKDLHISRRNRVINCTIHNIGIVYPSSVGIWIGQGCGNIISHNHIYDTYYSGVSAGWTWGYKTSNAYSNIIEHNHIHHIGRGMLSDMGAIYTLGIQPGTVIRHNIIHDIESYDYGGWGIYLDEGSTDILVENNLVYNTKSGGFHQHYGKENIVRNNIFACARERQIILSRVEEHISFIFEGNIVYCKNEPCIGGKSAGGKYRSDRNLYYRESGEENFIGEMSFERWQKTGQDKNSIFADPLFVAPEKGDYRLHKNSPAFRIGFKVFL